MCHQFLIGIKFNPFSQILRPPGSIRSRPQIMPFLIQIALTLPTFSPMARNRNSKTPKEKVSKEAWKKSARLFSYLGPFKVRFGIGLLFLLLTGATALIFPELMGRLVDSAKESDYETANNLALILVRSEEHTSELQSRENLVCRLLLEKKNTLYDEGLVLVLTSNIPPERLYEHESGRAHV